MGFDFSSIVSPEDVWLPVLAIAGWTVLMCLKTLSTEIDYAIRWNKLQAEARGLRAKQLQRLKTLGLKVRA